MSKQGMEQGLIRVQEIVAKWLAMVNAHPESAEILKEGLLLIITGENGGSWFFNGVNSEFSCGENQKTACTVQMADDVLLGIYKQRINPQGAYNEGKILVLGDLRLALFLSAVVF